MYAGACALLLCGRRGARALFLLLGLLGLTGAYACYLARPHLHVFAAAYGATHLVMLLAPTDVARARRARI
jgi:hypothetical protein